MKTIVLVTLGALACGAPQSSGVETTSAQVAPLDKDKAAEAIVRARCGHESACAELTGMRRFQDDAACAQAVRPPARASVQCDHEIESPRLTRCLDSIHTSGCNRRTDVTACTFEALCR
jgi:hypothetical protein